MEKKPVLDLMGTEYVFPYCDISFFKTKTMHEKIWDWKLKSMKIKILLWQKPPFIPKRCFPFKYENFTLFILFIRFKNMRSEKLLDSWFYIYNNLIFLIKIENKRFSN